MPQRGQTAPSASPSQSHRKQALARHHGTRSGGGEEPDVARPSLGGEVRGASAAGQRRVGSSSSSGTRTKPALVHPRVRHRQVGRVDRPVVERRGCRCRSSAVPTARRGRGAVALDGGGRRPADRAARGPCRPRSRALRKSGWAGPPTGAVSQTREERTTRTPGVAARRSTARCRFASRSPRFEPSPRNAVRAPISASRGGGRGDPVDPDRAGGVRLVHDGGGAHHVVASPATASATAAAIDSNRSNEVPATVSRAACVIAR